METSTTSSSPVSFPKETNPATAGIIPVQEDISHYRLAGFWRRYIAVLIDAFILFLGLIIIMIPVVLLSGDKSDSSLTFSFFRGAYQLASYLVAPFYMTFFIYKYGATPGKMAMHIKVVTNSNEKMTIGKAFMREVVGKFLSRFFGSLGFLWTLFDEKRQTWHDKIAHTFVIDTRKVTPEELATWKTHQKSYLPEVLMLSAFPYFLMFLIVLVAKYFLPGILENLRFLDEETINLILRALTIISVTLLLTSVAETVTGLVLFDKRKMTPFLSDSGKKLGVGVYIGVQIISFILILVTTIFGIMHIVSHLPSLMNPSSSRSYSNFNPNSPIFNANYPDTTLPDSTAY